MHKLLEKTLATTYDIWPFAVLLFLFMYIFSLLGMQFFANQLRFDDAGYALQVGTPRWYAAESERLNFDSFLWAITTVFVVITGENWNVVMYDCWRGYNWTAALYFMLLIVLGIFLLMNLFLAILLNNFGSIDDGKNVEDELEHAH